MIRTFGHDIIERFAANSSVPVINALTDDYHPCQLLADMQTWLEQRGPMAGKRVAWIGDGNNMCHSYINAARQFDFELVISCPKGFEPKAELLAENRDRVHIERDPMVAAAGTDLVVTDVWASMGQEAEQADRLKVFGLYQVNRALLDKAPADAIVLHCLPAHRNEEISEEVLESEQCVAFDQAENKMHMHYVNPHFRCLLICSLLFRRYCLINILLREILQTKASHCPLCLPRMIPQYPVSLLWIWFFRFCP